MSEQTFKPKIEQVPARVYAVDEIRATWSTPDAVGVIRMGDMMTDFFDACVDGREEGKIIGSPGGDAAVLVEMVSAIKHVYGKDLTPDETENLLRWYVGTFGTFYHHTDSHALETMLHGDKDKGIAPVTALADWGITTVEQLREELKNPQPERQVTLLGALTNPNYMGCGHLREMLNSPESYGVDPQIVRNVLGAFFNMLWNGSVDEKEKLNFTILEGSHAEGAVLLVDTDVEIFDEDTLLPTLAPMVGGKSVFVYHPRVVQFMHMAVATRMIADGLFDLDASRLNEMQRYLADLETKDTQETVKRLGFGLPLYSVMYTQEQLRKLWEITTKNT